MKYHSSDLEDRECMETLIEGSTTRSGWEELRRLAVEYRRQCDQEERTHPFTDAEWQQLLDLI